MMLKPIMEAASLEDPPPPALPLSGEATTLLAALEGKQPRKNTLEGHPR